MKLTLKKFNAQDETLQFQIVESTNDKIQNIFLQLKNSITQKKARKLDFQKKLSDRLANINMALVIDKVNDCYIVNQCQNKGYFLLETKKIFLDLGITLKNWNEFVSLMDPKPNIFVTAKIENQYDLAYIINSFLGVKNRAYFQQTCKPIYNRIHSPKLLLQTHFPYTYQKVETRPELSEKDYAQAFLKSYQLEYYLHTKKQKKLLTAFKEGDIHAVREEKITAETLRDNVWYYKRTADNLRSYRHDRRTWGDKPDFVQGLNLHNLLYWAKYNGQQHPLNYCYHEIILPLYTEHSTNPPRTKINYIYPISCDMILLSWAIYCYQPIHVIEEILIKTKEAYPPALNSYVPPLCIAAEQDYAEAASLLLQEKCIDANAMASELTIHEIQTRPGAALHYAVYFRSTKTFELLCEEKELNFNLQSRFNGVDGGTPLLFAVQYQTDLVILKNLLAEKSVDVNQHNIHGETVMHHCKTIEFAKVLCAQPDIDVSAMNHRSETPLLQISQHLNYGSNRIPCYLLANKELTSYLLTHFKIISDHFKKHIPFEHPEARHESLLSFMQANINKWINEADNKKRKLLHPLIQYFSMMKTAPNREIFKDTLCIHALIAHSQNKSFDLISFLNELILLNTANATQAPKSGSFVETLLLTKDSLIANRIAYELTQNRVSLFNRLSDEKLEQKIRPVENVKDQVRSSNTTHSLM